MAVLENISTFEARFLDLIRQMEIGRELISISDRGYNVIVGSTPPVPDLFYSYADHPRKLVYVEALHLFSTAAGGFQIIERYFDDYKKILGLPDFSPVSQEKIALQMLKEVGALNYLAKGEIEHAILAAGNRWMSFPGPSSQSKVTVSEVLNLWNSLATSP